MSAYCPACETTSPDCACPPAPKPPPTLADIMAEIAKIHERLDAQDKRIARVADEARYGGLAR